MIDTIIYNALCNRDTCDEWYEERADLINIYSLLKYNKKLVKELIHKYCNSFLSLEALELLIIIYKYSSYKCDEKRCEYIRSKINDVKTIYQDFYQAKYIINELLKIDCPATLQVLIENEGSQEILVNHLRDIYVYAKLVYLKEKNNKQKQKIKELNNQILDQSNKINELEDYITELEYRPGGIGYKEAEEHFDSCRSLSKKID